MNKDVEANTLILRHKAEEILRKKAPIPKMVHSEIDSLKAFQELEIHKIELELQYEELNKTLEDKDNIYKRYIELEELHNKFILHTLKKGDL
jgi:uncharacterized protein YydD (DUF2326 family)